MAVEFDQRKSMEVSEYFDSVKTMQLEKRLYSRKTVHKQKEAQLKLENLSPNKLRTANICQPDL